MKSDKQQMSFVPQTTEHVEISTNKVTDFKLPHGAIVEDVVIVKKVLDNVATGATLNVGTTSDANYYAATAHDIDTTSASVGVVGIDADKMMGAVASDRVVRVTTAGLNANSTARIWVWVKYRFAPSLTTPTQLV